MNCRTILTLLAVALSCTKADAFMQDSLYIAGSDTIRYSYTPLPEIEAKKSFLNRVVDYFGESTIDKTFEKKIDFTFVGGPSYSKTTSLGIGVLAAGMYRLDRTDSITPPSNISIFASASINGFYSLGIDGNNIFSGNKSHIDYITSFSSTPRNLWGIGYHDGANNQNSEYIDKHAKIQIRYLKQVFKSIYVGAKLDFRHTQGIKFTDIEDLHGENPQYTSLGIGAILEYDSRDFIPNPYRGIYISLEETLYPKSLGNNGMSLWKTQFTFNFYKRVWKGGTLAYDLYGEHNTDGTPWPLLARMGGSYRMRGYYEGRYTDNNMVTTQLELRQKVYKRVGVTAWVGAGNVFSDVQSFKWDHTLPNYGVGFRWEVKKRLNVRIDYGLGKNTAGLVLNINEAF